MSSSMPPPDRISSPASTGGAGSIFEQHVGAHWLALLLVRAVPPILRDCTVVEVHFQTEHLGWRTDDFLVVGVTGSGTRRRLLGQVKRSFTIGAADGDCTGAIGDFWKDFRDEERFHKSRDRLAIVTLRGTNTLLEHFAGLLDCARAAHDASDFEHRLNTPGFVHAKVRNYCEEIRAILRGVEGREVSPAEVWPFLSVLHVLSLDLTTSTGQTEAVTKTLLAHTADDPDPQGAANATWDALLREVGEAAPLAKGYTRDALPESIRRRHSPVSSQDQRLLSALADHSSPILAAIRGTIGPGIHLRRERLVLSVLAKAESSRVVLVTGAAGSGKSVIARDALQSLTTDHFCFCFRAEEFARPHLDETLSRCQEIS